jgi:hypothetical protein
MAEDIESQRLWWRYETLCLSIGCATLLALTYIVVVWGMK